MITRVCVTKEFVRSHLDELFEIEDNLQDLMLDFMLEHSMHFITQYSVRSDGKITMSFNLIKKEVI